MYFMTLMINPKNIYCKIKIILYFKIFCKNGYVVIKALNQSDFNKLKNSVIDRINTKIKKNFHRKKYKSIS